MIKKRQLVVEEGEEDLTAAELSYALVASSPLQIGATPPIVSHENLRHNRL